MPRPALPAPPCPPTCGVLLHAAQLQLRNGCRAVLWHPQRLHEPTHGLLACARYACHAPAQQLLLAGMQAAGQCSLGTTGRAWHASALLLRCKICSQLRSGGWLAGRRGGRERGRGGEEKGSRNAPRQISHSRMPAPQPGSSREHQADGSGHSGPQPPRAPEKRLTDRLSPSYIWGGACRCTP